MTPWTPASFNIDATLGRYLKAPESVAGDFSMTKLVAEADDLIAACHGDARGCVAALILVNQQLETELAELRAKMAARPSDEQMVHAVLH
jgi:hypothetical protein